VAVFGAVVNATLGGAGVDGDVPAGPLTHAVHQVFLGTAALALLMLVAVAFMPRDRRPAAGIPVPPEAEPVVTAD
jgi:hypothetical protein